MAKNKNVDWKKTAETVAKVAGVVATIAGTVTTIAGGGRNNLSTSASCLRVF